MDFSLLPPKRENFEAAIAYVERLRGSFFNSDFDAIVQTKGLVDTGEVLFLILPLVLMFTTIEFGILGLFVLWIPCFLSSIYCSAYSKRLKELLKVYDTDLSFRRRLRQAESSFQDLKVDEAANKTVEVR